MKQFTSILSGIGIFITVVNAPAAMNVGVGDCAIITSFGGGKFCAYDQLTGALSTDALAFVGDVDTVFNANKSIAGNGEYLFPNDDKSQSLLASSDTPVASKNIISVPEPSTVIASVLMLLPLGVSAIRIIRRKQAAE